MIWIHSLTRCLPTTIRPQTISMPCLTAISTENRLERLSMKRTTGSKWHLITTKYSMLLNSSLLMKAFLSAAAEIQDLIWLQTVLTEVTTFFPTIPQNQVIPISIRSLLTLRRRQVRLMMTLTTCFPINLRRNRTMRRKKQRKIFSEMMPVMTSSVISQATAVTKATVLTIS